MHANDVITSLERDVFPHLGAMPLADIDKPLLLSVLRKVEKRGAIETVRRLHARGRRAAGRHVIQGHMISSPEPMASPAIVEEESATTVVPPGYTITIDPFGNMLVAAGESA